MMLLRLTGNCLLYFFFITLLHGHLNIRLGKAAGACQQAGYADNRTASWEVRVRIKIKPKDFSAGVDN